VETAVPPRPAAVAVARVAVALDTAPAPVVALGRALAAAVGALDAAVEGALDAAVEGALDAPPPFTAGLVGVVSPPHDARRNAANPATPPATTCLRVTLSLTLPTPCDPI
jgi:hypothetical protein